MNNYIQLGKINKLQVVKDTPYGLILNSIQSEEVLLPNRYVEDFEIGDIVEVFIYNDSEDRLIATTIKPLLSVGEFGFVEAVDITKFGIFVDIGLPKDVLLPRAKQNTTIKVGDKIVVRLIEDNSKRLIVTQKFNNSFFNQYIKRNEYPKNKLVKLLVYSKTDMGYKVIVDNFYDGLIYHNEIFKPISIGDTLNGYIKSIRNDNKIDISLQKIGADKQTFDVRVYKKLLNKKFMPYNYKSDPDVIYDVFNMSKKNFKKALTKLTEEKKILIKDDGIYIC
jgi:predicted RNA-binding protein (virulence factor B family)